MAGNLNNGIQDNTDDTEGTGSKEPRTVPYNRIEAYPYRIRTVSTVSARTDISGSECLA
jgi:hypothetical protein